MKHIAYHGSKDCMQCDSVSCGVSLFCPNWDRVPKWDRTRTPQYSIPVGTEQGHHDNVLTKSELKILQCKMLDPRVIAVLIGLLTSIFYYQSKIPISK